jgi:hypothetical protein
MKETDWKAVADEIYMFLIGYYVGAYKSKEETQERMEKMRLMREEIIKINTKEVKA